VLSLQPNALPLSYCGITFQTSAAEATKYEINDFVLFCQVEKTIVVKKICPANPGLPRSCLKNSALPTQQTKETKKKEQNQDISVLFSSVASA
jgi:hypothetical protein